MKRHDFDPLSIVFGLLFPAFLIIAGAIVLANARKRERERELAEQASSAEDDVDNFIY